MNYLLTLLVISSMFEVNAKHLLQEDEAVGNGPFKKPLEPGDFRFSAFRSDDSVDGYSVFRIIPRTKTDVILLQRLETRKDLEINFWQEPMREGIPVDIMVSGSGKAKLIEELNKGNLKYVVQMADVGKNVRQENKRYPGTLFSSYSGFNYGRYHRLQEINSELHSLQKTYSSLATIFRIGTSYEGRAMYAIKISNSKGKSNKKTFFFNCGIHAREWVTPATCMYMINQMLSRYGRNSSITAMINKMDWVVLPVFNVDGYVYSWSGSRARFWRKTRSPNGNGCIGTDPNRNWNSHWGGVGAASKPCADNYHGPRPFSEIEVRQVARYLYSIRKRLVGYVDIHAYSQLWMYPWGYTKKRPADYAEMTRVSVAALNALRRPYGTSYKYGSSSVVIYATSGGSNDWVYDKLGVPYSFALELRDKGRYGFLLPSYQIIPTAHETFLGFIAMSESMKI